MPSVLDSDGFDAPTEAFLGTGCALIVGTVAADGAPHAGRAWGCEVVDHGPVIRLILDAGDTATVANLAQGGAVAVNATDVRTFRSIQLKGCADGVTAAADADHQRADRYCEDFFGDIHDTDGTDRSLVERMRPRDFVVAEITVGEAFDQTPGPNAGAPLPVGPA
jgi:hypothetical protein